MKLKISIYTAYICCICGTLGFPMTVDKNANEEEISGTFEGDMILFETQIVNGWEHKIEHVNRWPNKTVFYRIFPENFTTEQIDYIHQAMDTIANVSCVRFIEADENATIYVRIIAEKRGCSSTVGYLNITGTMKVNLNPNTPGKGCFINGTILHELLHTLGFDHMHSAHDRDDYVKILEKNIHSNDLHNFDKYDPSYVAHYNHMYDYESVMHYDEDSFSKNGERTIIPRDPNAEIGQRTHLSEGDIGRLNQMYQCEIWRSIVKG